jgi:hypothetical protein
MIPFFIGSPFVLFVTPITHSRFHLQLQDIGRDPQSRYCRDKEGVQADSPSGCSCCVLLCVASSKSFSSLETGVFCIYLQMPLRGVSATLLDIIVNP